MTEIRENCMNETNLNEETEMQVPDSIMNGSEEYNSNEIQVLEGLECTSPPGYVHRYYRY